MAMFSFKARDENGQVHAGEYEAASRESVADRLLQDSLTPISIQLMEHKSPTIEWQNLLPQPKVDLEDMVIFCRQMHALSRSGIPIMRAVLGLAETTRNPTLETILRQVGNDLSRGNTLSQSLRSHEHHFSPLFISMIQVGESTGNLDEAFKQLVEHLEMERDTKKKVKAALRYPSMLISAIFIAIIVVNIFVIPSFANVFNRFGSDLPLATSILLNTSNFFIHYWWVLLALAAMAVTGSLYYVNTDKGAYWWDQYKLRLPIVGSLLNQIALSRFTRTFAMLFKSGVPILQSLDLSAESVGNRYIAKHILDMRQGIERGDTLSRTAYASGMFTPLILQMIAVGEESGAVDTLLMDVSQFYDEETDYRVKNISASLEPILLVFMGAMILILALGVFLPMWDLGVGGR